MASEIILPEMGEGVIEGTLSRWLIAEGETIDQYTPVAEIETDKVTTEITSEVAGTVLKLCVDEGVTIPVDTVLAYVGDPGESITVSQATEPTAPAAPANGSANPPAAAPTGITTQQDYSRRISPVVSRIAAEHDVDLNQVSGSGRDGRITKNDILAFIDKRDTAPAAIPAPQPAPATVIAHGHSSDRAAPAPTPIAAAGDELMPLNTMRRAIADHMVRSKQTSPHVTTVFEFDFTAVSNHRAAHKQAFKRDGANLTFTVYIVAAVVEALKQHPLANSTWSEKGIVLKRDINIGMAAAVADGLVVPVIKQADSLNLLGLARVINDLTQRARDKRLTHADLQDGTFSITNHGTSGSLFATPIINQPQCGILGIGKIEKRVKVINDAIAIRPLAYASFTFDHRILDGATADAFVSSVKQILENWQSS